MCARFGFLLAKVLRSRNALGLWLMCGARFGFLLAKGLRSRNAFGTLADARALWFSACQGFEIAFGLIWFGEVPPLV